MKNFNLGGIHWKIWLLRGCSRKTNIEGRLPRKREYPNANYALYLHILSKHFFLFSINKNVCFSFWFLFCDEISNICNRMLTNQKPEYVIRNCQWNCMCNSSVINIRWVSLPPRRLPKVDLGQLNQIQLMGSAGLWNPTQLYYIYFIYIFIYIIYIYIYIYYIYIYIYIYIYWLCQLAKIRI